MKRKEFIHRNIHTYRLFQEGICVAFDSSSESSDQDEKHDGDGKIAAVHVISLLEDYKKSDGLHDALMNLV